MRGLLKAALVLVPLASTAAQSDLPQSAPEVGMCDPFASFYSPLLQDIDLVIYIPGNRI